MVRVLGGRLDQLRHDMRRRRLVRITHPEIDYVLTRAPRLQAQLTDRVEDVRWQPLDSWEIHRAISFNGPPSTPLVGKATKNLIEMKPTVGFKLPSAGVTPAPSI